MSEVLDITLGAGATMSFTATTELTPAPTPLPAALPLFATGIGGLGLLGWRRKRKARAVAPTNGTACRALIVSGRESR